MSFFTKCDSDVCYNKTQQAPMPKGWVIVTLMGETMDASKHFHFCSIDCASHWAIQRSNEEDEDA